VQPVLKKNYMLIPDWFVPILKCFASCLSYCLPNDEEEENDAESEQEEEDEVEEIKTKNEDTSEGSEPISTTKPAEEEKERVQNNKKNEDRFFVTITNGDGSRYLLLPAWYDNISLFIFLGVIIGALVGIELAIAAVLGLSLYVLLGIKTLREIISSIDWELFCALSISFSIGAAVQSSGLGSTIAIAIASSGAKGFPLILLTAFMTATLSNVLGSIGSLQLFYPVAAAMFKEAGMPLKAASMIIINSVVGGMWTPLGNSLTIVIASKAPYTPVTIFLFAFPIFVVYNLLAAVFVAIQFDCF
jgi:di/tricarboxylate transporter